MNFKEFQATGRDVVDLGIEIEGQDLDGKPGRVYVNGLYIEKMETTSSYNPKLNLRRWFLLINNQDWVSSNLEELEKHLYEFAVSEGYC